MQYADKSTPYSDFTGVCWYAFHLIFSPAKKLPSYVVHILKPLSNITKISFELF